MDFVCLCCCSCRCKQPHRHLTNTRIWRSAVSSSVLLLTVAFVSSNAHILFTLAIFHFLPLGSCCVASTYARFYIFKWLWAHTLTCTIKHTKNMLLRVYLRSQVSMGNGDSRIGESVSGWSAWVLGIIILVSLKYVFVLFADSCFPICLS